MEFVFLGGNVYVLLSILLSMRRLRQSVRGSGFKSDIELFLINAHFLMGWAFLPVRRRFYIVLISISHTAVPTTIIYLVSTLNFKKALCTGLF